MNQWLPGVNCPSIKQMLLNRLTVAVMDVTKTEILKQQRDIPVYRAKNCRRVVYISGVALLAKVENIPTQDIAIALANFLSHSHQLNHGDDFTVQVVQPGYISLELTDFKLAAWLQCLCDAGLPIIGWGNSSPVLFTVQYAHARCCSLLQLAARDGLIKLNELAPDTSPVFSICDPAPIPWLNCEHQLRLSDPAEMNLIACLVDAVDALCDAGGDSEASKERSADRKFINWQKIAVNLSRAFETFYSRCRIWGQVKSENLNKAIARLGLVLATQSVLKSLLSEVFGVAAPREL